LPPHPPARKARDLVIVVVSVTAVAFNLALQVGARLAERLERGDLEALRPLGRGLGLLPPGTDSRAPSHCGPPPPPPGPGRPGAGPRRPGPAAGRHGRAGRGRPGPGPARLVVVAEPGPG